MKLKNIILGLAVVSGLGLSSCTDLTPTVYSSLTTANAYSTASGIEAAVTGVYSDLNRYPGDAFYYYAGYLVTCTDYGTGLGYSASVSPSKMAQLSYDASINYIRINWMEMYQVINNCNIILGKIDAASDMTDDAKKLARGQLLFIRSLAYRDLTDGWGPVPMITEPLATNESFDYPLSDVTTIEDNVIIPDLKEAISLLPASWTGTDVARATKGAANMLLGKVYMRRHDYASAKPYIQAVLDGPYQLESDFREVWSEDNKSSKELIFYILHETGSNGGEIANHFGPSSHPDVPGRWGYYGCSIGFWNTYDNNDARKYFYYYDYVSNTDNGAGGTFIRSVRGYRPDNDPEVVAGNIKYLDNVPTMKYTYKMVSEAYYDGRTISIFRLSDAYLCMAEIMNNTSGVEAALPYINKIRARSGYNGADITYKSGSADYPVPTSVADMNALILKERGWELAMEYQNKPDCKRLGGWERQTKELFAANGWTLTSNYADLTYFPYPLVDAQKNQEMAAANTSRLPK